jgi:Short C-terminal domain
MSSSRLAKLTLSASVLTIVVSIVGFILMLVLNAFFLDDYDSYGEVPIPGTGSVHLPAGEVTVNFHVLTTGGSGGGGLPVPSLNIGISPPDGAPKPTLTEDIGSTTSVNNDSHIRVARLQVPVEGTYGITTNGPVNGYINPQLAFGHASQLGFLVWVFVGTFVAGIIASILAGRWLRRAERSAVQAAPLPPFTAHTPTFQPVVRSQPAQPVVAHEPSDEGVRLERLKTLAALRDSGALTEDEFQTEKRRILDGH